jgi:glycerol uptake facilitator-like aquaporin
VNDWAALAIIVASVASCTAATGYFVNDARKNEDPVTACVRAAFTQHDRIQCLQAK